MTLADETIITDLEPTEYTAEPRAWRKAQSLAEVAREHGWNVKFQIPAPNVLVLKLSRYDEEIEATWVNGIVDSQFVPEYTNGTGRHVKMRHIAAVRKQIIGAPDRQVRDFFKPKRLPSDQPISRLPFDIYTASEETILSCVRGKRIKWRVTGAAGMKREGWISKDARKLSLTDHPTRSIRVLNFCDTRGGYRSVALDQLVSVSS